MAQESSFTGRYKRYKAGTAKIVDWLAKTASSCCDIAQIVPSLAIRKQPGRKLTVPTTIELSTAELVQLATAISAARPLVQISLEIIRVLEEVIEDRQTAAALYMAAPGDKNGKVTNSNKTHQHFISALKQIHETLESTYISYVKSTQSSATRVDQPSNQPHSVSKKPGADTSDNIRNVFAELKLEEPVDWKNNDKVQSQPTPASGCDFSRFNFKLQKQAEEREFALCCHLRDLNDVRTAVIETWVEYIKGDVTFLLASVVTDVAFALMRCADDEFVSTEPSFADYRNIKEALSVNYALRRKNDGAMCCIFNTTVDAADHGVANRTEVAELLCAAARRS